MDVSELTEEEQLAFLGLAKLIVRADGVLSADENAMLNALAEEWGGAEFAAKIGKAKTKFATATDAMLGADAINRHEAQEFVFYRLVDLAASDDVVEAEAQILGTLAMKWGIDVPDV